MKKGNVFLRGLLSIKTKFFALIFLSVLVSILVNSAILLPRFTDTLSKSTENNLLDLAKSYGNLVDQLVLASPDQNPSQEAIAEILAGVKLTNVDSSYAYLVDKDGIMIYHPTADKIGVSVENEVVKDVVEKIKSGSVPEAKVVTYDFKGEMKYASYQVSKVNQWIIVMSADQGEILAPITDMEKTAVFVCVFLCILLGMLGFIFASTLTRPIKKVTRIISKTAELDFTEDEKNSRLYRRMDETGEMGRAIKTMRYQLREMLEKIERASKVINQNAVELKAISNQVNEDSNNNSATSQELAASMEETSATTSAIDTNIGHIQTNTGEINQKTTQGASLAEDILKRADSLRENTVKAREKTENMYMEVKERSALAIKGAKGVEKINGMTKTIVDISSKTGMLALNASIEAARAGEAGRGFAVVAGEIGQLASQSSQAVKNIISTVEEVNLAVKNMTGCMEETLKFLEENVTNDYNYFMTVGEQYNEDARQTKQSMEEIHDAIEVLNTTTTEIAEAVSGISFTINEAAAGVTDIAQNTSSVVGLTSKTYDMVQESMVYADQLKEIVDKFTL